MSTPFEIFRSQITLLRPINGFYVNGLWQDGSSGTLSTDLITGNTINLTLSDSTTYTIPFTTSSANTLALLQAALLVDPNVLSVSLTGTNGRVITIVPVQPTYLYITSFTVTGGMSQPTVTILNSPTIIPITASIQPLSGEEMVMLPEARREKEIYKMFTSFQVHTLTDENPDQVQFFGKTFEVYEVKPWQNTVVLTPVQNYCYYVMRIQPLAP